MARVKLYRQHDMTKPDNTDGVILDWSSAHLTLGAGNVQGTYTGTFSWNVSGDTATLAGGTINAYWVIENGAKVWDFSGADISIYTYFDYLSSGKFLDAMQYLLSGNDTVEGSHFSDVLIGMSGNDFLDGGQGDDKLDGGVGDDALQGAAGNDSIDGGSGSDKAVYAGPRENFSIQKSGTIFVVSDKTGAEGMDTLRNTEFLQFGTSGGKGTVFPLQNKAPTHAPDYGKDGGFLFDGVYYLLSNPELIPTVTLDAALAHYLSVGAAQSRGPNSWFDPDYYANKWADLKALNLDDATLFMHYNLYGVWEGRSAGPKLDRFDGNLYLFDWPDVAAYVDANVDDFLGSRSNGAIAHFIIYGANEQRTAYELSGGPLIDMGYVV